MATQWTRPDISNRPLAILGAGVLGRRIAATWIAAGYHVNIRDPSEAQRNAAQVYIQTSLDSFEHLTQDKEDKGKGKRVPGKLQIFAELQDAVQDAWFVLEAVPEKLQLKIDVMGQLDALTLPDCIIGSNSSSYKSSKMLEKVKPANRARICNVHYQMPPRATTVELMTDGETHPDIIQFLYEKLTDAGMLPAIARKESTGLILNRLWAAIKREVMMILAEGVSDPKEIDTLFLRMFAKNPSGPCAMMDGVGLDTVAFIEDNYVEERHLSTALTTDWLRKNYVDQGKLGAKSGKGGLYPAGITTKPSEQESGHHDNLAAPVLYFLDLGVGANFDPSKGFSNGQILTANADGTSMKTLIADLTSPDGIDVSISAGRIFWTSMGIPGRQDGEILSAKLDGSDVKSIIKKGAVNTPKQLIIDHENSMIYFCDREGQSVHRCSFTGSHHEILIQIPLPSSSSSSSTTTTTSVPADQTKWCVGIALDTSTSHIYWTQKGASKASQGRIFRAGLNIPPGETASARSDIEVLFEALPEPIDLEFDRGTQTLYWTDRGEYPLGNTLNRAFVGAAPEGSVGGGDGGEKKKDIVTLARHFHEAIGLKIDTVNHHIYVADLGGAVYRFNMDGSDKRRVVDCENTLTGIALAFLH